MIKIIASKTRECKHLLMKTTCTRMTSTAIRFRHQKDSDRVKWVILKIKDLLIKILKLNKKTV